MISQLQPLSLGLGVQALHGSTLVRSGRQTVDFTVAAARRICSTLGQVSQ